MKVIGISNNSLSFNSSVMPLTAPVWYIEYSKPCYLIFVVKLLETYRWVGVHISTILSAIFVLHCGLLLGSFPIWLVDRPIYMSLKRTVIKFAIQ